MSEFETGDETAGAFGSLELALRGEIAFWRDYIQRSKVGGESSVPQRAFDALALAEQKLLLLQTTDVDGIEMDQLVH